MPKLFAATIALFLLLGAGYAIVQAARAIPWDCSDWQPYAHADRTTAILESLAENRGKTLYCGLDQSDTFAKAETWQAGKDRNERDDTVYWGERGSFRGFIAAQEGWLTEGESGITGQSIATIFEFPKAERRTKRVKRFAIGTDPQQFPITDLSSCGQVLGLICSDWGTHSGPQSSAATAYARARRFLLGVTATHRTVNWETQAITNRNDNDAFVKYANTTTADWLALAKTAASRACRVRGAQYALNVAFGPGHSSGQPGSPTNSNYLGPGLGFLFTLDQDGNNNMYQYQARQSRTWTATCKKVTRRTR